jgi:cysteine synthase B
MPEDASRERVLTMRAYGADIILTPKAGSMELARDMALQMQADGKGKVLNQFANRDNPLAHMRGTGPEIWQQTGGEITHFVSAMGTTGTITGTSQFLKAQNPQVQVIGVQPEDGARISGIRKWKPEYLPEIYADSRVDALAYVSQAEAENLCRRLAREEGIFCGVSSAGACAVALRLAQNLQHATIVFVVCDRGDRYLSTGLFE